MKSLRKKSREWAREGGRGNFVFRKMRILGCVWWMRVWECEGVEEKFEKKKLREWVREGDTEGYSRF